MNVAVDEHVDWDLARRIAVRVAGTEPLYRSYLAEPLKSDFARFVPIAAELVAIETGLETPGEAHAEVIDRAGWIDANIAAFRRLLQPLLGASSSSAGPTGTEPADTDPMDPSPLMRKLGAVELGSVLGWMSRRVLGQYDLLWASDDESSSPAGGHDRSNGTPDNTVGDTVYFVGPNIMLTEKRYAFVPAQFRLWLALHELTHRSQFTGVGWLRPHFLKLVNGLVDEAQPDSERLRDGLRALAAQRRSGRDLLGEGGLAAVFATEEQRDLLGKVGGMMSLVEGHGDVTMARAARGHIPDAERFALVMHHRRRNARGAARLIQRLLGIEAKLAQYQAGEDFIAAIEDERGTRAVDRIWERPEHLPSMEEIRDPAAWMERVSAA